MSSSDKDVSDQKVEEKIKELRRKYASLAAVLERIHNMGSKRDHNSFVRN